MSKKANPVIVGSFVMGGLVIAVIGLLIFGGGKVFEKKLTCVAHFEESLSGLDVGAPVEFKGVRVGTVTDVQLIINRDVKKLERPVTIVLEPSRVVFLDSDKHRTFSYEGIDDSVKDGLRAQLASQSLLTGKLKIELSFQPETTPVFREKDKSLHEVPTVLSPIAAAKEKLGELQLDDIFYNINIITKNLAEIIDNEETKGLTKELNSTLQGIQQIIASADKQLSGIGTNLSLVVNSANKLMSDVDGRLDPATENLASIADSARLSIKNANTFISNLSESLLPLMEEATIAVERAGGALDERSTFRIELNELLDSLGKAAKSFTELSDYIEQHPESLLRGKK